MSTLAAEAKPTLLTLPAEIRLRIYSYIIPTPYLPIDLCRRRETPTHPAPSPRHSIALVLFQRTADLKDLVTNQNGLQLLLVCRRIASEVHPILGATTVQFCCAGHFKDVARAFQHGIGEGTRWMTQVEIRVVLRRRWVDGLSRTRLMGLHDDHASALLSECRAVMRQWYGRLDLMGKEKWACERVGGDEAHDYLQSESGTTQGVIRGYFELD